MMKFICIFLLAACLQVNAKGYSQNVTISVKNAPIEKVFKLIEKQTDYNFYYKVELLKGASDISLYISNTPIEEALNIVLKDQALTYNIVEKNIIISTRKSVSGEIITKHSPVKITGRVIDADEETPLIAASVLIKGTKTGTVTDANGNFTLNDVPENATLVISFTGYSEKEIKLTQAGNLVIRLSKLEKEISEIIVNGIFNRPKERFTGAVTSFTGDELKLIGNQNIIQSLKTLDPSFVLLENNLAGANPNALPEIEIRGKTSIPQAALRDQFGNDPNQPLFILDGFETSLRTILDLDMNRVASVTILKDAASTAIYGAKAANGVVVIETRKPKAGSMRISYTGDFRIEAPDLSDYNLMNAEEKLEFERLSGAYTFFAPTEFESQLYLDQLYSERLAEVRRNVNTYWLNEPVQTGFTNGHTIRTEGGDEQMRYAVGLNYRNVTGAMKGSGRNTWGGNVDLAYRKNKLNITNKLFINGYDANESPYGSFSNFARANPYYRKYNEVGGVNKYLDTAMNMRRGSYTVANPLYNALLNSKNNTKNLAVQNSLQMVLNLKEGLQLQGAFQVNKGVSTLVQYTPPEHSSFDNVNIFEKGRYRNNRIDNFSYQGNIMLTYSKVFENKHFITTNTRAEIQESRNSSLTNVAVGFPVGSNGNPAFSFGYQPDSRPESFENTYRRNNVLASINYSFDQRYIVDASYRLDGSTAFGSNKRYSPFWSAGIGWNLHNESYFKQLNWINIFRLRASTGITGNQGFGSISSISTYGFDPYINQFGQGVSLLTLGNPDLEWQRTVSSNLGADLSLFNRRLTVNLNVFNKNTDPLVVIVELPSSTGIYGFPMNVGLMKTRGAEAIIRYSPIYKPQQRTVWTLGFIGSTVKSKYAGFNNKLEGLNKQQQQSSSLIRFSDGYSPEDLWAVHSFGIDPATGKELFLKKNGQYSFEYDPTDIEVVGNSRPLLEGVLSSNLSLKGFTFGINVRYRYGGDVFNSALFNKVENISLANISQNQDKRALYDRWKKPGDITQFRGITISESTPMSSRFVQEDNTFSGESINIGYDFSTSKWLDHLHLSSLRVNAYMNDIFRVSTIRRERGIDYPFANTVAFSINATF